MTDDGGESNKLLCEIGNKPPCHCKKKNADNSQAEMILNSMSVVGANIKIFAYGCHGNLEISFFLFSAHLWWKPIILL